MATKPETKKDTKKDVKATEVRPKMQFAFTRKNYTYLIGGIILLLIGYIALSGGGSKDPNQFSDELFSTRRMVVAPIILLVGYVVVAYAILFKEPETDGNQQENQ